MVEQTACLLCSQFLGFNSCAKRTTLKQSDLHQDLKWQITSGCLDLRVLGKKNIYLACEDDVSCRCMVDYRRLYFPKRHTKKSPFTYAFLTMWLTRLPSAGDERFLDLQQDCDYSRCDAMWLLRVGHKSW